MWRVIEQTQSAAILELTPGDLSDEARSQWSYDFQLRYSLLFGSSGELHCSLNVQNTGTKQFEYQTLLHTYFRVADIDQTQIRGLDGRSYRDKVSGTTEVAAIDELVCTGETDRVYIDVKERVSFSCDSKHIELERNNLDDVVVWNPWTGCKNMADFGPEDGYKNMICVEAGAVSQWQSLAPGKSVEHSQIIRAK